MIRHAENQEPARVMVYGTTSSEETTYLRRLLTHWGVHYHFIDIDRDPFAKCKIARWNLGELIFPVVSCGTREDPRLFKPTEQELHGMLYTCDQVRVGPLLL